MKDEPTKLKLLLVDDEEEFLRSASRALGRRGLDVDIAPNGVTALEKIEESVYDVVVLDVKMPDLDGIDVFELIRKRRPAMPVILLTGHGSVSDAFLTSRQGVAAYLSKPIDMDELSRCIFDTVEKHAGRMERERDKEPQPNDLLTPEDLGTPIKVMLVDDEEEFLASMKKVLERRKLVINTADNGRDALDFLHESLVDVVVLDVKMPGIDGLEVLARIKESHPSVQVIMLSGHPSVNAALKAIKLGASEYLKKPPDVDELVSVIRTLYNRRQATLREQQLKLIEEIRRRYAD